MNRIGPGKRVSLHFTVSLGSGEVLDSTREREQPPTFVFGDGSCGQIGLGEEMTEKLRPGPLKVGDDRKVSRCWYPPIRHPYVISNRGSRRECYCVLRISPATALALFPRARP